jgi:hypothetical protein
VPRADLRLSLLPPGPVIKSLPTRNAKLQSCGFGPHVSLHKHAGKITDVGFKISSPSMSNLVEFGERGPQNPQIGRKYIPAGHPVAFICRFSKASCNLQTRSCAFRSVPRWRSCLKDASRPWLRARPISRMWRLDTGPLRRRVGHRLWMNARMHRH